jgi:hypothetical protein
MPERLQLGHRPGLSCILVGMNEAPLPILFTGAYLFFEELVCLKESQSDIMLAWALPFVIQIPSFANMLESLLILPFRESIDHLLKEVIESIIIDQE